MKKLDKNALNWYIKQLLHLEKDIEIVSVGSVTHLKVMGKDFYLYIKTLTYAGNPYPKNTTRAQLPKRDEFYEIKNSNVFFLFLGYDIAHEVFACWDPVKTKERLNERDYVSFFSRLNQQEAVTSGNIISASLQNDFKYVLFKLNDLPYFLLNIIDYFPNISIDNKVIHLSEKSSGILRSVVDDSSVKLLIEEQLNLHEDIPTLTLISSCMNEYGEFYPKMTLKDWHKIVNEYITNRTTITYGEEPTYEDSAMVSESIEEESDDSDIEIVYLDSPNKNSDNAKETIVKNEFINNNSIDTSILKHVFSNTVTSYKYFWFMAIISLAKERKALLLNYKDILIRMAAIAWPMVFMDNIHLGERDMMTKYLNEIHRTTSLTFNSPSSAVNNYLTQNYYTHRIEAILAPLLKNVPYRFLSPWIKYTSDEEVREKSNAENSSVLYSLHDKYIVLNNDWWNYINSHFLEVGDFAVRSFLSYAKQYNPEMKLLKIMANGWTQITNRQTKE